MGYGVSRRAKAFLAGRRYFCITGEWVADALAAGEIVGSGMFGYKVPLVHEFTSAQLHRVARSSVAGQERPFARPVLGHSSGRYAL